MKKNYFLLMVMLCTSAMASTIYVNKNSTGANTGTSWTNAYTTIEAAFANSIVGDQIWVASGVYKPAGTSRSTTYLIPNGVAVYGSFQGTETAVSQRDLSGGATTTLNGDINAVGVATDNCYYVVRFTNASNLTVLDGFKIVNGYNNSSVYGGAIYNSGGQPTIRNCEMIANYAFKGGGFGNSTIDSNVTTLINCKIRSNSATEGGGIFNNSGILKLINCDVTSNTANYGGGIHVEFDQVIIDRSILSGNSASETGGAIYLDNAACSTEIYNSLMVGNFANDESVLGMNSAFSNPEYSKIVNCTIANNRNTSTDVNLSFIITLPYNGAAFYNNIMTNNIAPRALLNGTVANSIIDMAFVPATQTNVITTAPSYLMANIAAAAPFAHDGYNYRLNSGSAGINSGNNSYINPLYTMDLAGAGRINETTVDRGAYEFGGLGGEQFAAEAIAFYPNPVEDKLAVSGVAIDQEYSIVNITGAVLRTGRISQADSFIDFSELQSGVYLLKLSGGSTHRIIKR